MGQGQANRLLGYPQDARLLILNADDFGMCNATNEAIIRVLGEGFIRSTTLMVPCPWANHAIHFLADHPEVSFGVHLTAISDPEDYRWGPVAPRETVPSLVEPSGCFPNFAGMPALLARVSLEELEREFRAQIEVVLAAGLKPDHLDWHTLRIGGRLDIQRMLARLAREYGLALRVMGQDWIDTLQGQGLPTCDRDFLDSYLLDPTTKPEHFARLLQELPAGLSEWAIHPGIDSLELLALEPANRHERQTDFDFWVSSQAKEIIQREGIILLDYRPLQQLWKNA